MLPTAQYVNDEGLAVIIRGFPRQSARTMEARLEGRGHSVS